MTAMASRRYVPMRLRLRQPSQRLVLTSRPQLPPQLPTSTPGGGRASADRLVRAAHTVAASSEVMAAVVDNFDTYYTSPASTSTTRPRRGQSTPVALHQGEEMPGLLRRPVPRDRAHCPGAGHSGRGVEAEPAERGSPSFNALESGARARRIVSGVTG